MRKSIISKILYVLLTVVIAVGCCFATVLYMRNNNETVQQKTVVVYQNTEVKGNENQQTTDITEVVEQIENSVVEIYTEQVTYSTFIGSYISTGAGSGVIYSNDGYIITNNHVIEGANEISVRLHDGKEYEAELIATDEISDLAIIKINETNLSSATFGTYETLKTGQKVIVIGNPLGTLGGTVSDGIISALSRQVTIDSIPMTLLQTNAAINPGNSGGGMFDVNGRLIGIVNAKSSGNNVEGIGFAIPIDIVKEVCEDLITNGYVDGRAWLDIEYTEIGNIQLVWYFNVNSYGIYVNKVLSNQLIEAGLKEKDIITKVNDLSVTTEKSYIAALSQFEVGETVTLTLIRGNKEIKIDVKLTQKK